MKRPLITLIASVLLTGVVTPARAQDEVLTFEGRVVWISGQTMVVAPDNFPTIAVDLTRIPQSDLRKISQNDYVVVTAVVLRPRRTMLATSIRWISAWYPQSP